MHLAPLASALHAMFARLPVAITAELDAGAVHQQVQKAICAAIRDLDGEPPLPAAQGLIGPARSSPVSPSSAGWAPSQSFVAKAT